jgi:hypothetical protein
MCLNEDELYELREKQLINMNRLRILLFRINFV